MVETAKRGFSSQLGVCTIIGKYTKTILDIAVQSSVCLSCTVKKKYLERKEIPYTRL